MKTEGLVRIALTRLAPSLREAGRSQVGRRTPDAAGSHWILGVSAAGITESHCVAGGVRTSRAVLKGKKEGS